MTRSVPVAIVGAGPYGLSLAAYLRARRVGLRIFGVPMESWRTGMPTGMFPENPKGLHPDLYDPEGLFTLKNFCAHHGLPYADTGFPVPLEAMAAYAGSAFNNSSYPTSKREPLGCWIARQTAFFCNSDDGETLIARRVSLLPSAASISGNMCQAGLLICRQSFCLTAASIMTSAALPAAT